MSRREYETGMKWAVWRWKDITWKRRLYLRRLILFQCPLFSVMLHFIKTPDGGRDPHDHPVDMFAIILKGWYVECLHDGPCPHLKCRKWFNYIPHDKIHRITCVSSNGAISLCFAGPRKQEWGFYTPEGFVPYEKYMKMHEGETS